jgi:hypothetical protein
VCPNCQGIAKAELFTETEKGCDDCGSHPALLCPVCDEPIDMIYHDTEEMQSAAESASNGDK